MTGQKVKIAVFGVLCQFSPIIYPFSINLPISIVEELFKIDSFFNGSIFDILHIKTTRALPNFDRKQTLINDGKTVGHTVILYMNKRVVLQEIRIFDYMQNHARVNGF